MPDPDSNEPKQLAEGQTVYIPAPAEGEEIPLEGDEPPPVKLTVPGFEEAPTPEPPEEPIDPGSVAGDTDAGLI
jgi:hypothetical protein